MPKSQTLINPLIKFISLFIISFNSLSDSPSTVMSAIANPSLPCPDSGPIRPSTPLIEFLERVQSTALVAFGDRDFDPKLYMDMSLKFDLGKANWAFERLPRLGSGVVPVRVFEGFVKECLNEAGSDLARHDPEDYVAVPEGFLSRVERAEVRGWALEVHSLWRNLSRRVVVEEPELHTLLRLPEPVMVPGSRFREVYYWDSYWVIRGLLASKMYDTAKSIVYNLIYLMDTYGIIPNGARAYYINRSQPPLLSGMVLDLYNRTGDLALVEKALPALLKEHNFWNSGIHKVVIADADGCKHSLNRYFAMWNEPRPETSTIDIESASKISNDSEKQHFYRELASAAESGWDFSSRWMRNQSDITTLATTSIIPVDLNAYILKMELDIVSLARATGKKHVVEQFLEASHQREKSIKAILWNDKMGQWLDYWLSGTNSCVEGHKWEACNQNQNAFVSNFIPYGSNRLEQMKLQSRKS
ncbi:hypothetical protein Syun_019816 [Stephania yunnanensis]|uniref:Trehalase n=1 Tax=Stephania yunnanensis TaxID=152371 RepID=A0AAP0NXR0_9MAGN